MAIGIRTCPFHMIPVPVHVYARMNFSETKNVINACFSHGTLTLGLLRLVLSLSMCLHKATMGCKQWLSST